MSLGSHMDRRRFLKRLAASSVILPTLEFIRHAQTLEIPVDTVHTSNRGRPMKLANGGQLIAELVAPLTTGVSPSLASVG